MATTHRSLPLYSDEAFEIVSRHWVKVGWNQRYPYTFTWMGRPLIQLPEDVVRIQEVIWSVRPDVILETGVAHGGSLIFYASLCKAMGHGRVIGIDIEIRPHNRAAIEAHLLAPLITMIEGDSTSDEIVGQARDLIGDGETVLVILDSDHSRGACPARARRLPLLRLARLLHRRDRRRSCATWTTCRRGAPSWTDDNPAAAAAEFAASIPSSSSNSRRGRSTRARSGTTSRTGPTRTSRRLAASLERRRPSSRPSTVRGDAFGPKRTRTKASGLSATTLASGCRGRRRSDELRMSLNTAAREDGVPVPRLACREAVRPPRATLDPATRPRRSGGWKRPSTVRIFPEYASDATRSQSLPTVLAATATPGAARAGSRRRTARCRVTVR